MAPSQTTTSPRKLRKQEERQAKKDKLMNENYQLGMMYEERYRYWYELLEKSNPDMSSEALNEWSINLSLQNRKQRRVNR